MKEAKQETLNELFEAINKVRKDNDLSELTEEQKKRPVGNNGFEVGTLFHPTGNINPAVEVKNAEGKVTATFIGIETSEGTYIPLQQLMGLSSFTGYSYLEDGKTVEFINEFDDEDDVKQSVKVSPTMTEKPRLEKCFKCDTRDLYQQAAILMEEAKENKSRLKGKTIQYKGTIVRQIEAKKESFNSFQKFKKGYKRVMSQKVHYIQ